ncbi:MAG TPA: hypothetical protein VM115_13020 [Vicinamibacterales bacterium]|nr:hypothetical protein [Vicinamibacterales bacterium]
MSVVPFTASPSATDTTPMPHTEAADARQRMLEVKRKLDEAASDIDSLQTTLASQHDLEQLLVQGRTHLQDLRNRLEQTVGERDRLKAELAESANTHQRAVEQVERQMDDLRAELQSATAERNRLASRLAEQEASHVQFAEERSDERNTFKRLLDEASSTQREMMEELDGQRAQLDTLREAAMRAQNFAREIMRAHDSAQAAPVKLR